MSYPTKKTTQQDLEQLVRFKSTADRPVELLKTAKWLQALISRQVQSQVLRSEIITKNGVPSLVMVNNGKWKNPDILLNGHFDVVPGQVKDFKPVTTGDKLFGRGAADMKSGVVSLVHAFIYTANQRPDLSLGLMLTGDEETGGKDGVEYLVKQGWKTKEVICFDGGYSEQISHAEKGILRLVFESKGTRGRVHHRWEGICALEGIIDSYKILEKNFPNWKKATEEDNWYSTFTPKSVTTEPNGNSMVTRAVLEASVHFTEDITPRNLVEKIRRQLPKNVTVKNLIEVPRVFTDKKDPFLKSFQKSYAKYLGHQPKIRAENGSSDARFFSHLNIPIIITKPKSGNPEMDGEWASITSTWKLSQALIDYLWKK
ncbi:MAG: hypothetical protein COW24_05320 [Candidatus Kerfeldbacteria bacterium CG15_BIG_FIL_POST_REV_8_21_14_020_45_12]|uniref:Peptidase M20 dimerisation domain-containing protein n=1 Tax=Candidatus Kerfeldbacteria bacterium CG15_BIG_FIL_POST_REV_8_21_14_020_45_12 TaxID=2014247 RepID=A0A2M7H2I1_9BACT|nr:MAG: hypothetical protein COW24_05320 [Candidatus Kerfeldbacteria bacterium CG15_BIG_FIL_POST_REV_8_21_14_020_45_12]PJA93483.1 MAG: hypothetical protein CO132_02535 [Candidatus Kerfeldbacteria bacterium CG_4_9_14_3_um_filter_45_8]